MKNLNNLGSFLKYFHMQDLTANSVSFPNLKAELVYFVAINRSMKKQKLGLKFQFIW